MSKLRGPRTLRAAISVLASLMLVLATAGGVAAGTKIDDVTPSSNTVGQGLISPAYTVSVQNTSKNDSHYYKISGVSGWHWVWFLPQATDGLTVASSDCVAIGAKATQPVHVTVATSAPATYIGSSTLRFTARQYTNSDCTTDSTGSNVTDTDTTSLVVVAPIATTTTLAAVPASTSAYGQLVTFRATVSSGTGTVQFKDGAGNLVTAVTLANGSASYPTSALTVGTHSITAVYSGDATHATSTSAALAYTVNKATTTTTLAAVPASPSINGQLVTFTAAVSPAAATGTIHFRDGANDLGTVALASGHAALPTATLSAGSHTIYADYSGSTSYASSSGSVAQSVSAYGTATKLAFGVQPSNATAGAAIGNVTVIARDQYNNTVTSSSASVSLALQGGTGNLSSTSPVNAVNGVATFSGLSVDRAGTFHLDASSSGLGTVGSNNFIISRAPLTLTITKYICTTYRQVPANANPTNVDATGGHGAEVGLDPANCETADGWRFGLYAGQNETTPIETTAPTSGGSVTVTLNPQEIDLARNGAGALWVSEVTQDGVAGFGAIRCYGDALNGDNLEQIKNVPLDVPAITCTAYNVEQVITFTAGPSGATVGASGFSVSASATSTLQVTYSSTTPLICSVDLDTGALTLLAAGSCRIVANQVGQADPFWAPAPQVTHDVAVGKAGQILSWTSTVPVGASVGGSYTAAAVSSAGLTPVDLKIDGSSTAGACSINGSGVVSFTGVGTCVVDANQVGDGTHSAAAQIQQSFAIGPGGLDHFGIKPKTATIIAGATQAYTAEAFDIGGNSLGDVTSSTVFTSGSGASCTNAVCTSNTAATYTVTGTYVGKTDTATLIVMVGGFDHFVISPTPKTIVVGTTQAYTAEAFDANGNSLGDVTASTTLTIDGTGSSCIVDKCSSTIVGDYTVTGTYQGELTATAILHVTAAPPSATLTPTPTATPIEQVGGATATPVHAATLPPTSSNGSSSSNDSLPLMFILIALAFGGLGILVVQAQRRTIRR